MSVNKSNELIQKASYKLSSIEAKILDKVISLIDTQGEHFEHFYYINLNDFVEIDLGIKNEYTNYTTLKRIVKGMRKKGFTIITTESHNSDTIKKELYTSWFANVESVSNSNIVKVEIAEAMKPYYFALNKNFTSYNANFIYKLKNKYSIRLYELLFSHKNQRKTKGKKYTEIRYKLAKLRVMFELTKKYDRFFDFKKYVLDIAKKELKEKNTDIQFDYSTSGRGSGKDIIFKIYNVKELREKEEQKIKEDKINNGDNIDKQIYTDIEKALKDGGVSKSVRNSLISKFDEMRIRRNIEMQYTRLANKKITRKELPGALVKSIKEDWAMGTYEENKERKENKEESKNTFDKPLTFENDKKEKTIDDHKKELKDNPFLYREFLDFLEERAKIKPEGYIASVLPKLENDQSVLDYEANLWPIINVFFGTRG